MYIYISFFFSSMHTLSENPDICELPNVYPESENNDPIPINQKLDEIIYQDNDLIQNNTFVSNIPRDPSIDSLDEAAMQYNMISIAQISSEDCGVPMSIFDNVCLINLYNLNN